MALPDGLRIRRYELGDFDQVWALHQEGVLQTRSQYSEVDEHYEDDFRDLEAAYLVEGANFWVVEGPDGLVGMTAIARNDANAGRLRRMRVTESWRRQGVAEALLAEAIAFCRTQGYTRLVLDTTKEQVAAQRMYEKAGFARTGQRMLGPFTVFDYVLELA
ncbi:MAG: GNAT family N-acetyltransferase [Dehalococcoidia bacterium]